MEPRDPSPSEDLPHKNVDGAIEESWSSDEEEGPATAGYTLLQNESGSDEEESSFLAPDESVPTMDDDGNEIPPEAMKFAPNHGLKPLTAEEEAKLRKEAFDNFDRNYDAEVYAAAKLAGRHDFGEIDTKGIASAMNGVQLDYRPAWSSFDDEQADEILKEVLKQHDIEWDPRSAD